MFEDYKKYIKGDMRIWGIIIFLSIMSILVVFSATADLAYKYQGGNTSFYLFKQLGSILMGTAIIIAMSNISYRFFLRYSNIFLLVSIILLVCAFFVGVNLNEASRWIRIPIIGFKFQPSEFAKIALIIYVARMLGQKQGDKEALKKAFYPIIGCTMLVVGLIFRDNLSTAILIYGVVMIMLIVGRIPWKQIVLTNVIIIALLAILLLINIKVDFLPRANTWIARIENHDTFQQDQAKIALATGGIIGKGPGNSEQRNFLPYAHSDFIFAIIAEEYGLWGPLLILGVYLYLLKRIGILVSKCTRAFPAFMALGLGFLLVSQALINMAVSVGIIPVTGQTLPLVSLGTTSIMSTCMAFGAILSVSRWNKEEALKAKAREMPET